MNSMEFQGQRTTYLKIIKVFVQVATIKPQGIFVETLKAHW